MDILVPASANISGSQRENAMNNSNSVPKNSKSHGKHLVVISANSVQSFAVVSVWALTPADVRYRYGQRQRRFPFPHAKQLILTNSSLPAFKISALVPEGQKGIARRHYSYSASRLARISASDRLRSAGLRVVASEESLERNIH